MLFFTIFIIIPLIEIALFITIGEEIGLTATLLLTFFTAIAGSFVLKKQGLKVIFEAQNTFRGGSLPLRELFDGFCLAIAGATLITPGFFTDFIGFCLLLPPFRTVLWDNLPRFFDVEIYGDMPGNRTNKPNQGTIDVEFERVDDENDRT